MCFQVHWSTLFEKVCRGIWVDFSHQIYFPSYYISPFFSFLQAVPTDSTSLRWSALHAWILPVSSLNLAFSCSALPFVWPPEQKRVIWTRPPWYWLLYITSAAISCTYSTGLARWGGEKLTVKYFTKYKHKTAPPNTYTTDMLQVAHNSGPTALRQAYTWVVKKDTGF